MAQKLKGKVAHSHNQCKGGIKAHANKTCIHDTSQDVFGVNSTKQKKPKRKAQTPATEVTHLLLL